MADEKAGFVPTGSSTTFTFGSTTSFASLNDLSRTLEVSSSSFENPNPTFPRSQNSAVATDHVFQSNRTGAASASPQQHNNALAWYDQVHPIPYPNSSSTDFKQEPLDDEWRYNEAEEESEDDDDGDREDEEDAPIKSIKTDEHEKKRRKRNKPTLSCRECVGKKMRVSLYPLNLSRYSSSIIDSCQELAPLCEVHTKLDLRSTALTFTHLRSLWHLV